MRMRQFLFCVVGLGCVWILRPTTAGIIDPSHIFRRGDANNDGAVDLSDSLVILNFLFLGHDAPPCKNQADVDHDGVLALNDAIYLNSWLFLGGPRPPSPGPENEVCTKTYPFISCDVKLCD